MNTFGETVGPTGRQTRLRIMFRSSECEKNLGSVTFGIHRNGVRRTVNFKGTCICGKEL